MFYNRINSYEDARWQNAFPGGAAGTAMSGCSCDYPRKNVAGEGQSLLWRRSYVDSQLACSTSTRRRCRTEGAQTRPQTSVAFGRSSGRRRCPSDYRPMPGSIEAALCPVDTSGRMRVDRKAIGHSNFGLDGRSLFETLGLYTAKTAAPRLRAKSADGAALAGAGVPCDSPTGPHRTCPNPLGRRNGNAFRSSGRTQVWSQGTYTGHSRNRPAVWLQYDLNSHQSRSFGLYGLQRAIYCNGHDRLFAAADPAEQAKSLFDYRWTFCASFQAGQAMGISESETHPAVLSAVLQPAVESRRISQSGYQDQCRRAAASQRSAGDDPAGSVVSAEHATPTSNCQKLF